MDKPFDVAVSSTADKDRRTLVSLLVFERNLGGWKPLNDRFAKALPGEKVQVRLDRTKVPDSVTVTHSQWNLTGRKFKDYSASDASGKLEKFSDGDLAQEELKFYWVSPGDQQISAKLSCDGTVVTARMRLNVIQPVVTCTITDHGAAKFVPTVSDDNGHCGLYKNGPGANVGTAGISWAGQVDIPPEMNPGRAAKWTFVQLVTFSRDYTDPSGAKWSYPNNGNQGLDTSFPFAPRGRVGGVDQWSCEVPGETYDNPGSHINTSEHQQYRISNESFETYLMFHPHSEDSKWVPLSRFDWSYSITCTATSGIFGARFTTSGNTESIPTEGSTTWNHPEWTFAHKQEKMDPLR